MGQGEELSFSMTEHHSCLCPQKGTQAQRRQNKSPSPSSVSSHDSYAGSCQGSCIAFII